MDLHLPDENTTSQLTQLLCKRRSVALTCPALMTKQHFSQMLDSLGTVFHRLQNIARKLFWLPPFQRVLPHQFASGYAHSKTFAHPVRHVVALLDSEALLAHLLPSSLRAPG